LKQTQARLVANKNSFRSVAKVITQRNAVCALNQFSVRMFANAQSIERSVQKLTKALEKEIKYENDNYSQLEDIETYLNESGFQFNEKDHGTTMVLSKKVGDKTIEVHFDAR
jgi:hypothetical protein